MLPKMKKGVAYQTRGIFADTGGWYALVDEGDPEHGRAREWFMQNRFPLITTDYILNETLTLIGTSLGHREAVEFGKKLLTSQFARLVSVTKEDKERAWEIFQKYDDKVLSFTDCTSFAVMERLELDTAFTLDHDFEALDYIIVPS